jgi:hypothetical protein
MNFTLTDHARKRIAQRQINLEWIKDALDYPARIESDPDDGILVHVLRPIAERGFRVLRVIYDETVDPLVVVTAYFDSEVNDL